MQHHYLTQQDQSSVTAFFDRVFTASEGRQEGVLVSQLAANLMSALDNERIIGFGTYDNDSLLGVILFSILSFEDSTGVYLLSPVGVSTEHQKQGIGQSLIRYGFSELRKRSVDMVVTYGDPAYYSQLGFQPVSESEIQAPYTLSMPNGWQGISLGDNIINSLHGRSCCVEAFRDATLW